MAEIIAFILAWMGGLWMAENSPIKDWPTTWIICYGSLLHLLCNFISGAFK